MQGTGDSSPSRQLPPIRPYGRREEKGTVPGGDGRRSCPPRLVAASFDAEVRAGRPFARLESVLDRAVSRARALEVRREEGGGDSSVQGAYEALATHIERFWVDDRGARCAEICRMWLSRAARTLSGSEVASQETAVAACMALDQLLALLLVREPGMAEVTQQTRQMLHEALFAGMGKNQPQSQEEEEEKDGVSPPGVPGLLMVADPLAEEQLRDEFRGRHTFLKASAVLVERNKALEAINGNLRRAVAHHEKASRMLQRQRRRTALGKAFYGWAVQARKDRELRTLRTAAISNGDRAASLSSDLVVVKHRLDGAQRSAAARFALLEAERQTMRLSLDTAQAIADRARGNAAQLEEQLHHLRADAEMAVEQRLLAQRHLASRWRRVASDRRAGTADNAFEHFNRGRCAGLLDISNPSEATLLTWCRTLCSPFSAAGRACFGEYGSDRIAASYLLLLHAISPGDVPHRDVALAMDSGADVQGKALAHHFADMQLIAPDVPIAEIHRRPRSEHLVVLSCVFLRFCGVAANAPLRAPALSEDAATWQRSCGWTPQRQEKRRSSRQQDSSGGPEQDASDDAGCEADARAEERRWQENSTRLQRWQAAAVRMVAVLAVDAADAGSAGSRASDVAAARAYVGLDVSSVAQLLAEARSAVSGALADVLLPHAAALRRIFVNYAIGPAGGTAGGGGSRGSGGGGDGSPGLSIDEFRLLCNDSHITQVAPQSIASAFNDAVGGEAEMRPSHFGAALLRLAVLLAAATGSDASSLTAKARALVCDRVLRYANGADMLRFKAALRPGEPAQEALSEARPVLQAVFQHYCDARAGGADWRNMLRLCQDARLVDERLSVQQLRELFVKVPEGTAQSVDEGADDTSPGAPAVLTFQEFNELVAAIAVMRFSSPLIALHHKIARLVDGHIATLSPASAVRRKKASLVKSE